MTVSNKLALVLAMVSFAGCATNPATGIAANGNPLTVKYSTGTGTYVSNDVVGTDVHTDSGGNQSTTDHYQPVEHTFQWSDWKYFQGREELDEQDFYRIAGDQQGADQIADIRAGAATKMKIGAPLAVIGLATTLILTSLGASSNNSGLTTLGYYGGSALGLAGAATFYWGKSQMTNRHHLPASRADSDSDVVEDCQEQRCTRQRGGRGASR